MIRLKITISLWVIITLAIFTLQLVISCGKHDTSAAPSIVTPVTKKPADTTKNPTPTGGNNPNPNPVGTYTESAPVNYSNKSNITISGLSIDGSGASTTLIRLYNCTNVHITNCRLVNTTSFAVNLYNCTNITIDQSFISNVGFGVYVHDSQTAKVNNNQILNINGIDTVFLGHAVQFVNVNGGGNQINNNQIENLSSALHPHDMISIYQSNGLPGDSILVNGNWIRGGQQTMWPTSYSGAAGIVLGDSGGSYQVARGNIIVNPGYIGMQAQGGTHIKMDHNTIYGDTSPNAANGMSWGNWSGQPSSDVIYAYNQVKYVRPNGTELDYNVGVAGCTLIGNISRAPINAGILPPVIITMK